MYKKSFYISFLSLALLTAPYQCYSQSLSLGAVAGFSLTSGFPNSTTARSDTYAYILGPAVEVGLPFRLSVEGDALYRPLNFSTVTLSSSQNTVTTWEFPVLAKYRFRLGPQNLLNPFIEAGPAFRAAFNGNGTSPSNHGITVGVGLRLDLKVVKFDPAVRYTHWAADSPPFTTLAPRTKQDQAEFVVGVWF